MKLRTKVGIPSEFRRGSLEIKFKSRVIVWVERFLASPEQKIRKGFTSLLEYTRLSFGGKERPPGRRPPIDTATRRSVCPPRRAVRRSPVSSPPPRRPRPRMATTKTTFRFYYYLFFNAIERRRRIVFPKGPASRLCDDARTYYDIITTTVFAKRARQPT